MKKHNYPTWAGYFMSVAVLSSFRSKDPKTQNGAVIVDNHKRIIGIGYNGLPRGCEDDEQGYWTDLDDSDIYNSKHTYVVHAEKNAIYNSIGSSLDGSTMYSTQFPCNVCAQAVIQVGIKEVVYRRKKPQHESMNKAVERMCTSALVKLNYFSDSDPEDEGFLTDLERLSLQHYD